MGRMGRGKREVGEGREGEGDHFSERGWLRPDNASHDHLTAMFYGPLNQFIFL